MTPIYPALAACLFLAACNTPSAPTINDRDIARSLNEAARISRLPETRAIDLPFGSATYNGQVGADLRGDLQGNMLGDMSMNVDFLANRVQGSVSNINLIDRDGRPDQALGGDLAITGFEDQGDILAGAAGTITGVQDGGSAFSSDLNLTMQGSVRDDRGRGDAVFGEVTGTGTGDTNLGIDGVFFGRR